MVNILKTIIKNKLRLPQYPSFVTFFVTWRCNCKCIMCNVWKKKGTDELTLEEINKIFTGLKPIDVIRISGGEPFLRKDLGEIINIIDKKVSPGIIHITTNGLLTDRIIETVQKIKSVEKVHLKVSIDDIGDSHDKIRGVPGAYKMAVSTVDQLSKLKQKLKFYLVVNQTIVDKKGLDSYFKLKSLFEKKKVKILPVIAYDAATGLYGGNETKNPGENSCKTFGDFSKDELAGFMKVLLRDANYLDNFKEVLIKRYYIKGLYNRIIKNKNKPNPACVAINSHLRILPNGDVPICMYNPTVIGNLKHDNFRDVWFGEGIKEYRMWVKNCRGCWAGCECNVSGVYSGDIWKGLF